MGDLGNERARLRELLTAATPRAPHYAHPESDRAKATRAYDAALRDAAPALLDRLDALEAVADAADALGLCWEHAGASCADWCQACAAQKVDTQRVNDALAKVRP